MTAPQLYKTPEAAGLLGVSESWLEKQVAARLVPHRRIGNRVRFSDDDIAEIVARSAVPALTGRQTP